MDLLPPSSRYPFFCTHQSFTLFHPTNYHCIHFLQKSFIYAHVNQKYIVLAWLRRKRIDSIIELLDRNNGWKRIFFMLSSSSFSFCFASAWESYIYFNQPTKLFIELLMQLKLSFVQCRAEQCLDKVGHWKPSAMDDDIVDSDLCLWSWDRLSMAIRICLGVDWVWYQPWRNIHLRCYVSSYFLEVESNGEHFTVALHI